MGEIWLEGGRTGLLWLKDGVFSRRNGAGIGYGKGLDR